MCSRRRACHAYTKVLGVDATNGMQETASWASRSGKLAEVPAAQFVGYPDWMTTTANDEVIDNTVTRFF